MSVSSVSGSRAFAAQSSSHNDYTIQRGDTLSGIAARHGVSLQSLIAANPQIRNPNLIYPGDAVTIPSGGSASRGGNTASAAAHAGGSVTELKTVAAQKKAGGGSIEAMKAAADKLAKSNIGYDQNQRWTFFDRKTGQIHPGKEADCSAICGAIMKMGGYNVDLNGTFYTGNFAEKAKAAGFEVIKFKSLSQVKDGDFLLAPSHHVEFAYGGKMFSARIDERGHATGGQAGNQNGRETGWKPLANRSGGWTYIVRPPKGDAKPSAPPTGNPTTPAPKPTTPSGGSNYTVRSGDTMSAIASHHGVSLSALIAANPQIKNPNLIHPGQTVHIPAGGKPSGSGETQGPSGPGGATPGSLQGRINEAMGFFESKGWSRAQAAGIVGNLQAESGVDPNRAQNGGGPGYGLAQWEGPRQAAFKAWAGHDIHQSTFREQLEFIQHELTTTERGAGNALKGATTASEAAQIFCNKYERPGTPHMATRIANAEAIYKGANPTNPGGTDKPGGGSTTPKPTTPSGGDYTVRSGDTMSAIASRHGVSLSALIAANPQIKNPNLIHPGQTVHIPGGGNSGAKPAATNYTVRSGDTMSAIASRHGVSLSALIAANPQIKNPNLIHPGQTVHIPGGSSNPAASAPKPAASSNYTVRSGDTMSGIAARHGVSLAALKAANPQIKNINLIHPGQTVHIPGGSSASGSHGTSGPGATTGPSNVKGVNSSQPLANAARSVAMSMGGYHSQGLCATGVSRAIQKVYGIKVWGNGNQIDDNLPRSKFKQIDIPLSEALKIPGLVLTWEKTSTALGSKYGHTAITLGDGHSSASDFIENNTLAGNNSRSGLKIFMPI